MEENESTSEFQLGFVLPSRATKQLLELSALAAQDPYDIIIKAIETLHKAHSDGSL